MFSKTAKVAFGVILVSIILNVWQYVSISSLETSLFKEETKVVSLEKDIERLENNAKIDKAICESEQEALEIKLKKEREIKESVSNAKDSLKDIRREIKNEQLEVTGPSGNYGRDIARVLNNACREIFGQDCPNPK